MKKVIVFKADDEFKLVKQINDSELDIFATTPIQKNDGSWVAFIYYNSQGKDSKPPRLTSVDSTKQSSGKSFNPTREQLEKWKDEDVTEGQRNFLIKFKTDQEINNISKLEAHQIIKGSKQK